jgi:molybdate transport system ATP-binding protein
VLELRIHKRLGSLVLDAGLAVPRGVVLALVGESGSGKTTLLRLLAGLLAPDQGRVTLGGQVLFDRTRGIDVPAHARPVGYVAQDYALFPHLSAFENVAFGLRAQGMRGAPLRTRVAGALERVGIRELGSRRPQELSGGQQQRVALARALVLEPEALLLDEPLAALDRQTRRAIRAELRRLLAGLPCVTLLVTHDPTEALTLGERVAVLEAGRITQEGPREELLHKPRTRYVAEFLGTNLFHATVRARDGSGVARLTADGGEILAAESELEDEVFAVVDPREITISPAPPGGSAQNVLRGTVEEIQPEAPSGDRLRVSLATRPPLVAELTRRAADQLGLAPGLEVYASFKATGVRLFR